MPQTTDQDTDRRAIQEQPILDALDQKNLGLATTTAMELYGQEIFRWLLAVISDEDQANDVFSDFTIRLLENLASFRRQSSVRTWAYMLARSARANYFRKPANRKVRHKRLSQLPENLTQLLDQTREQTLLFRRTEVKDAFVQLRERHLSEEEQTILILRIDRRMTWKEVAQVMADEPLVGQDHTRAAANLRQQFKTIKAALRELAQKEGLAGHRPR